MQCIDSIKVALDFTRIPNDCYEMPSVRKFGRFMRPETKTNQNSLPLFILYEVYTIYKSAFYLFDSYLIVALFTMKLRVPLLSILNAISSVDWEFSVVNNMAGSSAKFTQIVSVNFVGCGQQRVALNSK